MPRPVEHAVVIVGAGPTGMMLGAELTLAGVDVAVVERRATIELDGSRAGGLHARTLEILDQRGVADRFLAEGQTHPAVGYAYVRLDISDFPTRHNYLLALWQKDTERILAGWLDELGVPIRRGTEVTAIAPRDDGVEVRLAGGEVLRAQYLVGCDGGRSLVRKAAGIDFVGWDASTSYVIAEVEFAEQPPVGVRREGGGIGPRDRAGAAGPYGVTLREPVAEPGRAATLDDVRAALVRAYGTDFGVHSPAWISRFTDASRQAAMYRKGRILLAGDAAHVHSPMGGQGLNVGMQDAVNLGWKLAQVVRGTSGESLLDTYHAERHPVGARVLRNTMAQTALVTPDDRHDALRAEVSDLLALDAPRRRIAGMISGLDVAYGMGDAPVSGDHPLIGRRMPDLDLRSIDGPTRVFDLLHEARPVLLVLRVGRDGQAGSGLSGWAGRVRRVDAEAANAEQAREWELPVIGVVPAPGAVLIRPDGHVAWAGELGDPGLPAGLTKWFGAPHAGMASHP
jgi:3-(3-hydroxy-phenyl)propionate hydroxylase